VTFFSLSLPSLRQLEQGLLSLIATLAHLGVCWHRQAEFGPCLTRLFGIRAASTNKENAMNEPVAVIENSVPIISPFEQIVNPSSIKAAADRIAQLGLPRLVVKAFSEKDRSEPSVRSSRRTAALKPR